MAKHSPKTSFRKQFDFSHSQTGIMINLVTQLRTIYQIVDPWRIWLQVGFITFQQLIMSSEVSMFPTGSHNQLREIFVGQPGVGPSIQRTTIENQIIVGSAPGTTISTQVRNRSRYQIIFAPLIWIPGLFYAYHPEWRVKFSERALAFPAVPTIFTEFFKRTRYCTTPVFRILSGVFLNSYRALVLITPDLANTFWDPNFLGTESGMSLYFAFLARLYNAEENYVPFTVMKEGLLPPLEANEMITFTAYCTSKTHDFLVTALYVLGHNHATHGIIFAIDCVLSSTFYALDVAGVTEYIGHRQMFETAEINSTYQQNAQHIVNRVFQVETNGPGRLSTPVDNTPPSTKSVETPPQQPAPTQQRAPEQSAPRREPGTRDDDRKNTSQGQLSRPPRPRDVKNRSEQISPFETWSPPSLKAISDELRDLKSLLLKVLPTSNTAPNLTSANAS